MFFCLAYCDIRKGIYLGYNDIASLSFKFSFQTKRGYLKNSTVSTLRGQVFYCFS